MQKTTRAFLAKASAWRAPAALALRYVIAGAATSVLYIALYLGLSSRLAPPAPSIIAMLAAVSFQYCAHAAFTFRRRLFDGAQLTRFAASVALGSLVSISLLDIAAPALGAPVWLGLLAVVIALPALNLAILSFWVFARRNHPPLPGAGE